ncbi:MAG: ABC transporter permease, partial [Acidobacteriaceae bacterium]
MSATIDRVSGKYFQTVGVPILAGRSILPSDTASSFKVVVVNQSLAKHFFPKGNAVGHILTIDDDNIKGPWQIVGVAKDTRSGNPRDKTSFPTTYLPLAQIDPWVATTNP